LTGSSSTTTAGSLAHAQGEPADPLAGHTGQADLLQHRVHPRPADAVAAGQAGQVGEGAAAGVGGVGVEDRADLVQRPADLVVPAPADQRLAGRGAVQAEHHAHGGRLAGPVGSQEAGHHAGADLERQPVDGRGVSVAFGQLT
jgi:hypothetical protein